MITNTAKAIPAEIMAAALTAAISIASDNLILFFFSSVYLRKILFNYIDDKISIIK